MQTITLEILLFAEDRDLAKIIYSSFSEWPVHIRPIEDIKRIAEVLDEDRFDLLIIQSRELNPQIAQTLHTIEKNFPVLFINLITEQHKIPQSLPAHLITQQSALNIEGADTLFARNLYHLAADRKIQAELSVMLLHDIRSPAQSIFGYMELLEQEVFGEINEGQRQIILSALTLGDSIIDLMEELGEVYQFEKKAIDLFKAPLDLKQLLDETLRALWVQADRKNIKFMPKIAANLPNVFADSTAIRRVLNNLIQNAIKYSPDGGTVRISVKATKEKTVEFKISDSGPGLPEEQIEHIFEKYFRISDYKHKHKGQGLGLYICKLIAESHGGTVGAANNPDGGSVFTFTMPALDDKATLEE